MRRTCAFILFAALACPACTDRTLDVSLDKGIKVEDLKQGIGLAAKQGSGVTVSYTVGLKDGTIIISTYEQDKTHKFTVGDDTVIKGLDHAVVGMKPGGIRRAEIPAYSHYGLKGHGDIIPPGEPIIMEIKMVDVRTSW